jgi:hypothetical protein
VRAEGEEKDLVMEARLTFPMVEPILDLSVIPVKGTGIEGDQLVAEFLGDSGGDILVGFGVVTTELGEGRTGAIVPVLGDAMDDVLVAAGEFCLGRIEGLRMEDSGEVWTTVVVAHQVVECPAFEF